MLDVFKSLEIYDKSLIALISDHGNGKYLDVKRLGKALPILLYKKAGATSPIRKLVVPTDVTDIAKTIADEKGVTLHKEASGMNLFEIPEDSKRRRSHLEYEVAGSVHDPKSWSKRRSKSWSR